MKNQKTLVIHPKDRSTTFLNIIYKGMHNKTVITEGVSKDYLREIIPQYDRVMIMGHGCPDGLFSIGKFGNCGLVIDRSFVDVLKDNPNNVYIWCNADQFINRYQLKGVFSGMFISEVGEAYYCGLPGTDQDDVDESNFGFCKLVKKYRTLPSLVIHRRVKNHYGKLAEENQVAYYNNKRLYFNGMTEKNGVYEN